MRLLSLICVSLFAVSCSLPLDEDKVPAQVRDSFAAKYPKIKGKWMHHGGNEYKVRFHIDKRELTAVYNLAGNLLQAEYEIAIANLPSAITDFVKNHMDNAKIQEAAFIRRQNGSIIYEVEVKGKDYFFTPEGKQIEYKEAE